MNNTVGILLFLASMGSIFGMIYITRKQERVFRFRARLEVIMLTAKAYEAGNDERDRAGIALAYGADKFFDLERDMRVLLNLYEQGKEPAAAAAPGGKK